MLILRQHSLCLHVLIFFLNAQRDDTCFISKAINSKILYFKKETDLLLLKTLLTYGTMNWSASQKIAMVIFSWLKYLCCRRWSIFNIKYELIDLRAIGKNCSKWVWKNIYLILVTEKKSFKSESLDQKCYPTPNHDKAVLASHDKTLEISKICAMSTRHVFDTG